MIEKSASDRQRDASQPNATTWLSANAGSGKTRVLTDRVARLLLAGVQPQHILCLTYTKAAATEMQNRLFKRLGEWSMKPVEALRDSLAELGIAGNQTPADLAKARRLFARAIETPGGLRIQTIHSFCATLLRRFPLEAEISPNFTELDDRAGKLLRAEIVEEMADRLAPGTMRDIATIFTRDDFERLVAQVAGARAGFGIENPDKALREALGVRADESADQIIADVFLGSEAQLIADLISDLQRGKDSDIKAAGRLAAISLARPGLDTLTELEGVFLTATGKNANQAKIDSFPTKDLRISLGDRIEPINALMRRVESGRARRVALMAVQNSVILHRFAKVFLPLYAQRKLARGCLDFDDLITRAIALLTDRAVAAWVLYRLDGGIDHILVDEAQDTSPDQWRVIELLSASFSADNSGQTKDRTLFVVGDKKQSIYSFQGADVAAFDEKHAAFRASFTAASKAFQTLELKHSFRSSEAILQLVDRTFGTHFPEALGQDISHIAFKNQLPGRVDLWPLIEPVKTEANESWEDPVDLIAETHHAAQLAQKIASEIKTMISSGVTIPVDGGVRPVHAGDFLILVQRRSDLFAEIIRCCKQQMLPIAGSDRLKLGGELAVKDLTALLAFLATPEDDLSLAATLRSPLLGWTEAELYDLAHGRKGFLWEALRNHPQHAATLAILQDLRDQADYLRPYDLIERVLLRHDGRRRLLARLGDEAEEGIDALLTQAQTYEQNDVPSLTGFLIWLETDEVEVKRQMDSEGQRIRVMTVHGAKGLEAPIVILPDTTDRRPPDQDQIYQMQGQLPVWRTAKDESPDQITALADDRHRKAANESLRLLYVALTRARCWLIVAGAGEAKTERKDGSKSIPIERVNWAWYRHVEAAMLELGALPVPAHADRLRYSFRDWPEAAATDPLTAETKAELEAWAQYPAEPPLRSPRLLSPSDLGGEKTLPGDGDLGNEAAMQRGTALHLLLEHLPQTLPANRKALATALVPDPVLCADVLAEATAVLESSNFAHLFTPDALAEVSITADLPIGRMLGTIDRLLISKTDVLAIDYKSNRLVPQTADQVPEGLLRQLGAYANGLRQIYPDRQIKVAILWTKTANLMLLDPEIVSASLARATIDGSAGP